MVSVGEGSLRSRWTVLNPEATLLAARRVSLSLLAALSTAAALVAPAASAQASGGPTVALSAPATATGLTTVTATGDVDPAESDAATSMALLVNGTPYGAAKACVSNGIDECPTTFTWDSTALNGSYTLQARLVTRVHPDGTLSTPVTVTAVNPAPTVTITSPKPSAVAKVALTVTAVGTVDLSQTDAPVSLQLWLDGRKYLLPQSCTVEYGTAKTCDGSFTDVPPGAPGTHTLQVTMTTGIRTATSAVVPYIAYTASKVVLNKPALVHSGKLGVVSGRVIAAPGGGPIARARVAITLAPAVGRKRTLIVHTGATGHFSLATRLLVNSTVTVTATSAPGLGGSHAVAKIGVWAPITCKADRTVVHARYDVGSCIVPRLPDNTKVSLQDLAPGAKRWHVLGAGTTVGTTIPISFQIPGRGSYRVRLVLGANKAYVATNGTPLVVKVT